MTGFEQWISDTRSNRSTNCATTVALILIFFQWAIHGLFLFYFCLFFKQFKVNMFNKSCRWLNLNSGSLVLEVTVQSTLPLILQNYPISSYFVIFLKLNFVCQKELFSFSSNLRISVSDPLEHFQAFCVTDIWLIFALLFDTYTKY